MNTRDPRVRVMPHYAIEESWLSPDGLTLLEPHSSTYVTFLANQIADLICYFESRHHRTRGEVSFNDDHLNQTQMTPPLLNWGTPNTSGNWGSQHSTPRHEDDPTKPKSGVSLLFWIALMLHIRPQYPFSLFKPCYMASAPSIKLLRETATIKDVVRALNNFYDEFLEQNIRINLDHANQEDINDGELNKQNATRVF
jgi:hypothetical protein